MVDWYMLSEGGSVLGRDKSTRVSLRWSHRERELIEWSKRREDRHRGRDRKER